MLDTSIENRGVITAGLIKAILIAGLIAGTLDIIAAIVQTLLNGGDPMGMLRFIASGVFGTSALKGGAGYATIGLLFHYCIATIWSTLFFLLYPRIRFLSQSWVVSGVAYGFFVWLMMNRVVLPLSNTPPLPFKFGWNLIKSMMIIIFAVGLPVSFFAKRYFEKTKSE